jgi:hypothetical protein
MKDFTIYYLFKMQPNALLIWPKFYYLQKPGVTRAREEEAGWAEPVSAQYALGN